VYTNSEKFIVTMNFKILLYIVIASLILAPIFTILIAANKLPLYIDVLLGTAVLFLLYVSYLSIKIMFVPVQIISADKNTILIAFTLKIKKEYQWDQLLEITEGTVWDSIIEGGMYKYKSLKIVFAEELKIKTGGFLPYSKIIDKNVLQIREDWLSSDLKNIIASLNSLRKGKTINTSNTLSRQIPK